MRTRFCLGGLTLIVSVELLIGLTACGGATTGANTPVNGSVSADSIPPVRAEDVGLTPERLRGLFGSHLPNALALASYPAPAPPAQGTSIADWERDVFDPWMTRLAQLAEVDDYEDYCSDLVEALTYRPSGERASDVQLANWSPANPQRQPTVAPQVAPEEYEEAPEEEYYGSEEGDDYDRYADELEEEEARFAAADAAVDQCLNDSEDARRFIRVALLRAGEFVHRAALVIEPEFARVDWVHFLSEAALPDRPIFGPFFWNAWTEAPGTEDHLVCPQGRRCPPWAMTLLRSWQETETELGPPPPEFSHELVRACIYSRTPEQTLARPRAGLPAQASVAPRRAREVFSLYAVAAPLFESEVAALERALGPNMLANGLAPADPNVTQLMTEGRTSAGGPVCAVRPSRLSFGEEGQLGMAIECLGAECTLIPDRGGRAVVTSFDPGEWSRALAATEGPGLRPWVGLVSATRRLAVGAAQFERTNILSSFGRFDEVPRASVLDGLIASVIQCGERPGTAIVLELGADGNVTRHGLRVRQSTSASDEACIERAVRSAPLGRGEAGRRLLVHLVTRPSDRRTVALGFLLGVPIAQEAEHHNCFTHAGIFATRYQMTRGPNGQVIRLTLSDAHLPGTNGMTPAMSQCIERVIREVGDSPCVEDNTEETFDGVLCFAR